MTNAEPSGRSSRFKLLKIYPNIVSNTLNEEIQRRKIPYDLANQYLCQAFVLDRKTQRKYIAFAFQNASDAYEVNIPYPQRGTSFKASIGNNTFSFFKGLDSSRVEVFSSFWDFLTWLTMTKQGILLYDTYVLNGTKPVSNVIASIETRCEEIKSVIDFIDNNDTGEQVRTHIANAMAEIDTRHGSQNYLFSSYKDVSDYWMYDPEAQSIWPLRQEKPKVYSETAWDTVTNTNGVKKPL